MENVLIDYIQDKSAFITGRPVLKRRAYKPGAVYFRADSA